MLQPDDGWKPIQSDHHALVKLAHNKDQHKKEVSFLLIYSNGKIFNILKLNYILRALILLKWRNFRFKKNIDKKNLTKFKLDRIFKNFFIKI